MRKRLTILLLSPDGGATRKLELTGARTLSAVALVLAVVGAAAWLGWAFGDFTAGLGLG